MNLPVPHLKSITLVQTWRWLSRPFELLDECARRFGPVFAIRIAGFGTAVVIGDPDLIRDIFAGDPDTMHAGKANGALRPFLGDKSLIVLDGSEHARQRRLLMPAFHGERMTAYGQIMLDQADAAIDRWPLGPSFPLHPEMGGVTLQVILRTVFGLGEGARLTRLSQILKSALDTVTSPLLLFPPAQRDLGPLTPWGRFCRLSAEANEILFAEIARRREEEAGPAAGRPRRDDVLSMLIAARDETGAAMTKEELRDELITLLVAGHETTATGLCWAMRWILATPEVYARLVRELDEARGPDGALLPDRLARLPYLDATVRETLRLQPVIPLVARFLTKDVTLRGLTFPRGVVLAPSIYLAQRRPEVYPEPGRFLPDRFLSFKPGVAEWLPFGGGVRRCIGAAFATYEMKMVLGALLDRTRLSLCQRDVAVRRRSITLTPADGLPVRLLERSWRRGGARTDPGAGAAATATAAARTRSAPAA